MFILTRNLLTFNYDILFFTNRMMWVLTQPTQTFQGTGQLVQRKPISHTYRAMQFTFTKARFWSMTHPMMKVFHSKGLAKKMLIDLVSSCSHIVTNTINISHVDQSYPALMSNQGNSAQGGLLWKVGDGKTHPCYQLFSNQPRSFAPCFRPDLIWCQQLASAKYIIASI